MVAGSLERLKCTICCIALNSQSWRHCLAMSPSSHVRVPVCLSVCHCIQVFLVDEVPSDPHVGQLALWFEASLRYEGRDVGFCHRSCI